jgi:hypothetical protein
MFRLLRTFFLWLLRALRVLAPGSTDARPKRPARAPLSSAAPTKRSKSTPRSISATARAVPDATGGLQIEYAPRADGGADPGEVVWTWVPYEDDPSQGKDRPVLVVGYRGRRRVGLALTSKDTGRHDHVEIGTGPWDREGRVSYAKLDRLIDLELMPIRREGAVLDRARFDGVARALRRVGRA